MFQNRFTTKHSSLIKLFYLLQKAKGKAQAVVPKNKSSKKKKVQLKFSIDCSKPVEDGIMNVTDFVSIFI